MVNRAEAQASLRAAMESPVADFRSGQWGAIDRIVNQCLARCRPQAKAWLKRASEAAAVEKVKKPVRFSLVARQFF